MDTFVQVTAYTAFVFAVILMGTQNIEFRGWYKDTRKRIGGMPPTWIFPTVWTILYGLMIPSGVLYFEGGTAGKTYSVAAYVLYFVGLIFNFVWMQVFFRAYRFVLGLIIILALFGMGLAYVILAGLDAQYTAMGLYIPYVVWLLVALYLNARIIYYRVQPPRRDSNNNFLPTVVSEKVRGMHELYGSDPETGMSYSSNQKRSLIDRLLQ